MATFAPSAANRIAVARPIPLPAPVMKATLPASLGIDLSFSLAAANEVLKHDAPLAQCRDLFGRIAAASKDLVAVLAKGRGRRGRRPRCSREFYRLLHRAIAADLRMIEGCDKILGAHLRMV